MTTTSAPVVVITGASSGIGRATAEAFARRGAVIVLAARSTEALETVAQRCRDLGAAASACATDVTVPQQVAALADHAIRFAGRIDIWVSNVGTGAVGAFHETPIEAHEQVVRADLLGHMNDAHAVLPVFLRQGRGIFVNMISVGGFAAVPYATAYSASKFGLRGFAEALRGELAVHPDIHICDVYPAFVDAPGIAHAANYTGRALSAPPPLLDPREVADAIVRLSRRPKPTTMIGVATPLIRIGHFLSPELSTRLMSLFMRSYLRRAPRVPRTSGNLTQPRPDGIDGGLRWSRGARALAWGLAGALSAVALLVPASGKRQRRPARAFQRHNRR